MAAGRPGIALSALVVTGLVAIALVAAAVGNPFSGSGGGHAIPHPSLDVAPQAFAASADSGRAPVAGSHESARQAATDATGRVAVGLPSEVVPLPVRAFAAPIARYRRYSAGRARAMTVATGRLLDAARAGDRDAARQAWEDAYEQFARIGAAYGALGALGAAVDARPGSLPGGVHDPGFRGLHAVERALWTGAPPASVVPLAARLDADARRLPHRLATMPIETLDFSLRPHEILEDAQRDELTGGAAQWSGAGLRATAGAYAATKAMLAELAPVLQGRGDVLPPVQHAMARLGRELDAVRTRHGGWPALGRLSDGERERVDGAVGQALEALAAVPGDLEHGPAGADPADREALSMGLRRRDLITGAAGVIGGGALGAAGARAAEGDDPPPAAPRSPLDRRVRFDGVHQAGITTPPPAEATVVALDAIAPDRASLVLGLQALSTSARQLTRGYTAGVDTADDPPPDSGTLGPVVAPDALTVTVGFGASLFDDRYGLARSRPRHLRPMTAFPDDDLDPARTHGDVVVQLCANRRDTVTHALRELLRPVRGAFAIRWSLDGFQSAARGASPAGARRNLLGFRDGTANPEVRDAEAMNRLVWVQPGGGEPAWTAGGTYLIVRAIRMHVEFWDRVGLREQETMIGRDRARGAPLGGAHEHDDPRYDLDPEGDRIPLDAHIRLANPRTPATADQRFVRRGYNYHRGVDGAGQLDQGLLFIAFNQNPARQFETVQRRLAGEPLVDYITPVGGGYFFVPPGARGQGDHVGSGMTV